MTFILAASGKKQSGKDTLLQGIRPFLQDKGTVRYYSFADELKNFLQTGLGLKREQVWGTDAEKNQLTNLMWDTLPLYLRWERGGCMGLTKSNRKIKVDTQDDIRHSGDVEQHFMDVVNQGLNPVGFKTGPMSGRDIMQVFGTDIMRRMFSDRIWVDALFRAIERDNPAVALIPDMRFPSEFVPLYERGARIIRLMRDVSRGDSHLSETALDGWEWEKYSRVLVISHDATIDAARAIALSWLESEMK